MKCKFIPVHKNHGMKDYWWDEHKVSHNINFSTKWRRVISLMYEHVLYADRYVKKYVTCLENMFVK
jgi:hypothetical protein